MKNKIKYFLKLTLIVLLWVVIRLGANDSQLLASPPSEFDTTELVSGLNEPTAFRFMPDGRIFISEKSGSIKVFANGQIQPEPVITLVTLPTDFADERGVLGIEPDPDFVNNGFLYVAYTTAQNYDRLSRITVTGNTADPASELILLESDQQGNVFHHGGEVRFGPDGKLYWAMGMNTNNLNSQNLTNLHGKIHRINKDGSIPTDNPFYSTPGAVKSIWAYGLRNPFRFTFLPDGRPIVGDVGGDAWEELNIITKGGNYGWPNVEGNCSNCPYVNPVFTYHHTDPPAKAGSITSTLLYTGSSFPGEYQNSFFYGDYTLGFIKYLKFDSNFESVISDNVFDQEAGTVVQLSQGPDGNIYKLDFYPGSLSVIAPSGGNRTPIAAITPSVTAGLAPLLVNFDSGGSEDPDGTVLNYLWNFGDGNTSTETSPSHTYTVNGTYNASLTVSDGEKSDTETVIITVGNNLPNGTIVNPANNSNYNAGDIISFSASGTDPEDGELPDSSFSWSFVFHHADHIHPFGQQIISQRSGQIAIPRTADNLASTWYEIILTTTDSQGLTNKTSTAIYPNLVELTFSSNYPNTTYTIDGIPHSGVYTETAVVGVERVLNAPSPQYSQNYYYKFLNWSNNQNQSQTITTPSVNAIYTVNFEQYEIPPSPWISADVGSPTIAGDASYLNGVFTINGAGGDIWGTQDEFRYVYQTLQGNGEIIARVTSQENTDGWAKSGIMVKQSAAPLSPYALLAVTPNNGITFQHSFNTDFGSFAYNFPNAWLKLVRFNNTFTAYTSLDGINWQTIGIAEITMSEEITIGMFVTSHKYNELNTSVFDNVSIRQSLVGLWQNTDIGSPIVAGSSGYVDGVFTVNGSGSDIWGEADQFQYVHQTIAGNGEIIARITSQTANTDGWAKAGVMFKESLTPQSPYVLFGITPQHGFAFQTNFHTGSEWGPYNFPNAWVRLARNNNLITSFYSSDGINWTEAGSTTLNFAQSTITVGLFVTSHNASMISTATFDNVALIASGQQGALPSPFIGTDIGNPKLLGSASFDNQTFTIKAAGDDIWAGTDQMYFVHQDFAGDAEIIARVNSQTNTNDWAKAGLIIKDSASSLSNYALLAVTPGNGITMQYNFNGEVTGPASYSFPNAWLKMVRSGNNISSYYSFDGNSWILIGTREIILSTNAKIGLFVTSHDGSKISTATFDSVSISNTLLPILPTPWQSSDIGAPILNGNAVYVDNIFTINGAGSDIWGDADQFHFVYQPLIGDGEIIARVRSQTNTNDWAKAGMMIKDSLLSGSDYALLAVTPNNGIAFQSNFINNTNGSPYSFPNIFLKLTRTGNNIASFTSIDGHTWTPYAASTVNLGQNVLVGLFVTSHNGSQISTATFDQLSVLD